jgi:preprotein translocase subunit SecD
VLRDGPKEKDLLPLKHGEVMIVHNHKYQKKGDQEQPRFLVVRPIEDVRLDLVGAPKAIKEGGEVVAVRFKLQPKAAADLEELTRAELGKQVVFVVNGEVVTVQQVREVIKGGAVQITTCCSPKAAEYLLDQSKAK